MNSTIIPLFIVGFVISAPFLARAQEETETSTAPLYSVTVVGNTQALNYKYLNGSTLIGFKGTLLMPQAKGEAKIKNGEDSVSIDAIFEGLEPPTKFGPEYLTYVLWTISPAGRAANAGEVVVKDGKARVRANTDLQTFALVVTAEPYYAVTRLGNLVMLENVVTKNTKDKVETVEAHYELPARGQYAQQSIVGTEEPFEMDKKISSYVYQARNAVRIARMEQADIYAPEEFKKAEDTLAEVEKEKKKWKKSVAEKARVTIQQAEDARIIAVERKEEKELYRDTTTQMEEGGTH